MTIPAKSLVAKWKKDPAFKAGYDALGPEFEFVAALMAARKKARLSQTEIAERMGTKQSAVARLESGKSNPSWATIREYAKATGMRAKLVFEVETRRPTRARKVG